MFDLHTHSLLSDGGLLPSELARRYEEKGFKAIAITDHADLSNIRSVAASIVEFCRHWPKNRIKVIPGVELTHLPLNQFKQACDFARGQGIRVIVVHGETLVEPVLKGTNREAILCKVDILAHPGLLSEEDARLAARKGVFLEISARRGHCLGNGHVARLALKTGTNLCINSDSHAPGDIPGAGTFKDVALGAGLSLKDIDKVNKGLSSLLSKLS